MNLETIGNWAGLIWTALNGAEEATLTVKGLKKATKLKKRKSTQHLAGWAAKANWLSLKLKLTSQLL